MKFSSDFFNEEIREGFKVSSMMKRAWSAEMEIWQAIADVCRKNNITYYADGGTLLGAIRHKGFIPWDDDMDLCMLREDLNLFLKAAKRDLPDGIVIEGMYADDERLQNAAEVSHIRVIADENAFPLPQYMTRFHGFPYLRVGVDIFILDYMYSDKEKLKDQFERYFLAKFAATNTEHLIKTGEIEGSLKEIEERCKVKIDRNKDLKNQLWLLSDRISAECTKEEADGVFVLQFSVKERYRNTENLHGFPLDWFGKGTDITFEETTIHVPDNYLAYVEGIYGSDYMTPKKFEAGHNYPFYKEQEKGMKQLLLESGINVPVEEFARNWHMMNGGN